MLVRILLILLGLWLLRRVWRLFFGVRRPSPGQVRGQDSPAENSAFRDPTIKDAEFEEIDDRNEGGGGS